MALVPFLDPVGMSEVSYLHDTPHLKHKIPGRGEADSYRTGRGARVSGPFQSVYRDACDFYDQGNIS